MKRTILKKNTSKKTSNVTSLWLLIGGIIILGLAITFMTLRGIAEENRQMETFYEEKGASLITALEAGARTDFRHNVAQLRLQTLLQEMANQPDILFIMATDAQGNVITHSNPNIIGAKAFSAQQMKELKPSFHVAWRIMEQNGEDAFVVYREFRPFGPMKNGPNGMMRPRHDMKDFMRRDSCGEDEHMFRRKLFPPKGPAPIIYVGLNGKTFANTLQVNKEHALVNAVFILLIGLIGFVALTWAQKARRSRKRMQSSEALLDEVMYSLPDGLIVTDEEGRIALINDVALEQLDVTDRAVVGKLPSESLPECVARLVEDTQHAPLSETEVECISAEGQKTPVGVSGSAVTVEDGLRVGFVFLLRDLREVRRLEEEVRRKEKLAAVGSLAAGVAHEIRNPLSSIKGYATYFGSRFEKDSEDRNAANIMVEEVERLNRVIGDLINLSRPSDLRRTPTNLNKLAEHCFGLIKQDAAMHNVELNLTTDSTLPELSVDPDRLSQAILNISLNSLEAMPEGGTLAMNLSHTPEFVTMTVSDTGKGISKTEVSRIFEPYFTTKSQGTGLGLPIVLKIIEAHGGTIRVESQPDSGTVFIIELPVSPVGENA